MSTVLEPRSTKREDEPADERPEATILVALVAVGSDVWRTAQGRCLGANVYEILAPTDYDPDTEVWEFPPGTVVECTPSSARDGTPLLVAVRAIRPKD